MLLADDTATVRLLLRRTLESSRSFVVVGEASDGGQAVAMAEELQPDMVVLDMAMPVMGGLEAIPCIRRCAPAARVVVLSGFTPGHMGSQALQVGAAAYLEKHQRPDELVAGILQAWRSGQRGPAAEAPTTDEPTTDELALAMQHAPGGMALVDADDRLLHANPALLRMTGHEPENLRARTLADLALADDPQAAAAARRAVLRGDRHASSVEARLLRADGKTVWVLLACSRLPDPAAGNGAVLVVQFTDISEQKRALAELHRSNAELGSFAFLAAHELKSPIQAMSGFAALLRQVHGPALDPQAQEFVGWISDGAARMDALIEDLLDYCSVDTAEAVVDEVALDAVLAAALAELECQVASRSAVVRTGTLPVVVGDPVQLGQLIQNLLANALKFVPEGQSPVIEVSADRTEDGWLVTVADNGIGVEDASSDRIFAMFERLHPRERFKGTGIGLSICKRIVERRGGAIWVEHNAPHGSRFRFSVPDALPAVPTVPAG
ncbi:MAG TPA: ATP-binding protein [Acidimicrobiales bacterium]|nr:ATP-binding protein [Acidimicrobiales bacterium]